MTGGQKLDEFVSKHFSRVGQKNPRTHRWNMKCHYCVPDIVMEHRELRCTEHLSKYEQCPNAPKTVRDEALQRLATKRGALSSLSIDELGTPSNPHVVGNDDTDDGVARKKGKATDGSTTVRRGVAP